MHTYAEILKKKERECFLNFIFQQKKPMRKKNRKKSDNDDEYDDDDDEDDEALIKTRFK